MSNQRPGKTHAAALGDRYDVPVKSLITFLQAAQMDLTNVGEDDSRSHSVFDDRAL